MQASPDDEPLQLLSGSVFDYLKNLEACRQTCIRHASTTEVTQADEEYTLLKRLRYPPDQGRFVAGLIKRQATSAPSTQWALEGKGILRVVLQVPAPSVHLPVPLLRRFAAALEVYDATTQTMLLQTVRIEKDTEGRWPLQHHLLLQTAFTKFPPPSAFQHWPSDER